MATALKQKEANILQEGVPSAVPYCFGILVAEWNRDITHALWKGAYQTLIHHHALDNNIYTHYVPGSFELVAGANYLLQAPNAVDAVICLGCLIQGETRHFEFICQAVANGLTNVAIKYSKPVTFGVLTTNNYQQARDRSGGKHGNKGNEAALAAIKMIHLAETLVKNAQHSPSR